MKIQNFMVLGASIIVALLIRENGFSLLQAHPDAYINELDECEKWVTLEDGNVVESTCPQNWKSLRYNPVHVASKKLAQEIEENR